MVANHLRLRQKPPKRCYTVAISPDGQWLAVAREDSEVNEGVIDLWSTVTGQILQKFYHPWQISALHFADKQLVVAQTDGTIQIWQ